MKKVRYSVFVLLVLMLARPLAGWAAPDEGAGEKIGGRSEGFRLEAENAAPATFGPIVTDTAIPLAKGKFSLQSTTGLGLTTNRFHRNWGRTSARGDFQSLVTNLSATYGLATNLDVNAIIYYIHNWASALDIPGPHGERSSNFGGLGDTILNFKYQLVQETATLPTISAHLVTIFPTGHFNHLSPSHLETDLIGHGSYAFTPGLNFSKWVAPFIFYANFYYTMHTAVTRDGTREYPRDFASVNLAAEYPFTAKWVGCLELVSSYDTGRLFGHPANTPSSAVIALIPELEYIATEHFSLSFGVSFDLAGKRNPGGITPLFSLLYLF